MKQTEQLNYLFYSSDTHFVYLLRMKQINSRGRPHFATR